MFLVVRLGLRRVHLDRDVTSQMHVVMARQGGRHLPVGAREIEIQAPGSIVVDFLVVVVMIGMLLAMSISGRMIGRAGLFLVMAVAYRRLGFNVHAAPDMPSDRVACAKTKHENAAHN